MRLDIKHIRQNRQLTFTQQLGLTLALSLPAMLAQLSSIAMQYIDAAMVGRLGADPSASIGLVSTSLWLFWGICSAMTSGYSVQVAHSVGANNPEATRRVFRQGIVASLIFSIAIALIGTAISQFLPHWLGGEEKICKDASIYFLIFVAALPLLTINYLAGGILRCAGNMKIPSIISTMMCVLDCLFNFLLIFPSHNIDVAGFTIHIPGADLGVMGAALGTVAAETVCAALMLWFAYFRQPEVRLKNTTGSWHLTGNVTKKAVNIATPLTVEHAVICGAQIAITMIVAPLGVIAIAANAFAVTAESICYMPGYGIGDAATTLTGQCHGASRPALVKKFGLIAVGLGMAVMTITGLLLYIFAPEIMALITPVDAICRLGADVLRIEAWAEPMFAASIVAYGAFIGVGHTRLPAIMNFGSIWLVRVPLAFWLSMSYGLQGVWIAMCAELIFRGLIFLARLFFSNWWK